eukprot:403342260
MITQSYQESLRNDEIAERILERLNIMEVDKSVEAYLYLGKKGILSNIGKKKKISIKFYLLGQNREGTYYFVIYGYAYEKEQDKKKITECFNQVSSHLGDLFKWTMIYVHSNLGATKKGALLKFKQIYANMTDRMRANVQKIYLVQPTMYVQSRLLLEGCISKDVRTAFSKLETFKKELSQMKTQDMDFFDYTESVLSSGSLSTFETSDDPYFTMKSASVLNYASNDKIFDKTTYSLTHDVIGKNLKAFYREKSSYIPLVFKCINKYFEADRKRYYNTKLFDKLNPEETYHLEYLETHITLGNYQYIQNVKEPKIIMQYLKSILKCMEEPLCTFTSFPLFKNICSKFLKTTQFDEIIELVKGVITSLLDLEYQETWKFLLRMLYNLTATRVNNKKMLAGYFSELVFKTPEFWSNDLIIWRSFQDLLALMIHKHESIFAYDTPALNKKAKKILQNEDLSSNKSEFEMINQSDSCAEFTLWDTSTQDKFSGVKLVQ